MSSRLEQRTPSPQLQQALVLADEIAKAADCELLVDSGTLLGLVRNGDMIAGDLDLDLSLADETSTGRLVDVLRQRGARIWVYAGRPYRAELPAQQAGLPLAIEVKLFRREGDFYVCPAVGFVSPAKPAGRTRGLRDVVRPLWRHVLGGSDAGRFPMKHFARVDAWRVPASYFDDRAGVAGTERCRAPLDVDAYLTYRYGDWREPTSEWVTWRDDGAYVATSAAMQAARKASPHRRQ